MPVYAQSQTPSSAKAGIIESKILDESEKKMAGFEEKTKVKPGIGIEDQRLNLETTAGQKVYIEKFVLNGITKFEPEDFVPFLSKYRNTNLGLEEFNQIALFIQQYYRSKGYITTFVYVPDQKIKEATVEIKIIEGYLGNIVVEDTKYSDKEFIRERFAVKEGETVLYQDLMQGLKRVNTNPDRTVKAVLVKGDKPETTDISLKVNYRSPKHMYLEYDNRGTKYTGESRLGLGYIDNNVFGFDEMLSLKLLKSNERLIGGSMDYNIPVSLNNARFGGYLSYVQTEIVKEFKELNAEGKALTAGIYLSNPLIDEEHLRGILTWGFDIKDSQNYILNTQTSNDDLSIFKVNFSLNRDDIYGGTFFSNELDYGIPDFAGSLERNDPGASRIGSGGEFTKYIMQLKRQQNLPLSSYLLLSCRSQYSPDKLVSGEQFYIGGMDTVRGYPELAYMGDYGYNLNLELRTPLFILPKKIPWQKKIQMVYFLDFGQGYLRDPLVGEKKSESLMSSGAGLRFNLWKNFYLRMDLGFPINPDREDKSKSELHIWGHLDLF
ncbi:MAG: ShlB/FhaC/HecB family hemolysin secretion/activation protein [Candidatus Omnitrophota bacterium]|nr:BamA/TamA family outer membrane protein [Candidatus Omnitrophota bacterium]MBU2258340.1 BamA/TamA family outer membrane protein [Candidatus Omnitrophota bacterium]